MKAEYPTGMLIIGIFRNLFYKCYIALIAVMLFTLRASGSQIPIVLPIAFLVIWIVWSVKAQVNHRRAVMSAEIADNLLDVLVEYGDSETKSGIEDIIKLLDDIDD